MWNDQTVEALTNYWNSDTLSAEAIAAQLSSIAGKPVTKNMVVGKARRLKLKQKVRGIPFRYGRCGDTGQVRRISSRRKRHAPRNPHYSFGKGHDNYTPSDPVPEIYDPLDIVRVKFLDREEGQCGWPIGDPKSPGFGCCGDVTLPGETYCPRHKGRAFERVRSFPSRAIKYAHDKHDNRLRTAKCDDVELDVVDVLAGAVA